MIAWINRGRARPGPFIGEAVAAPARGRGKGSGGQGRERCACDPGLFDRRCRPIWTREQHGLVAVRGSCGFRAGSLGLLGPGAGTQRAAAA
jgi:hypothetical protein